MELDTAPKKLSELSTKAQHHHGAVQPFIAGSMESQSGYDTYRVYLLFDDDVGMSMYAGASADPRTAVSLLRRSGFATHAVDRTAACDAFGIARGRPTDSERESNVHTLILLRSLRRRVQCTVAVYR